MRSLFNQATEVGTLPREHLHLVQQRGTRRCKRDHAPRITSRHQPSVSPCCTAYAGGRLILAVAHLRDEGREAPIRRETHEHSSPRVGLSDRPAVPAARSGASWCARGHCAATHVRSSARGRSNPSHGGPGGAVGHSPWRRRSRRYSTASEATVSRPSFYTWRARTLTEHGCEVTRSISVREQAREDPIRAASPSSRPNSARRERHASPTLGPSPPFLRFFVHPPSSPPSTSPASPTNVSPNTTRATQPHDSRHHR